MRLEYMKEEFPKMPDSIRTMIEEEVENQIGHSVTAEKRTGFRKRRTVLLGLAAALAVGGGALAAGVYRFSETRKGIYGREIGIINDTEGGDSTRIDVPSELPVLAVQYDYLPEGMVQSAYDDCKLFYEDTPDQGGISLEWEVLDADEDDVLDMNYVADSELLSIGEHSAVYMELENKGYSKRFYVLYPEYYRVLTVYVGEDVSKDAAVKVLENMVLTETGEMQSAENLWTWSDIVNPETETDGIAAASAGADQANIYAVGEQFDITLFSFDLDSFFVDLSAKVSDVQIADDISLLEDLQYIPETWTDALDEDGNLLPGEISYIRSGDGVNTLDEIVKTESVARKLVYVTVEITNTTETDLTNLGYYFSFAGIVESEGEYALYDRAAVNAGDWDKTSVETGAVNAEMEYYDVRGTGDNNGQNYIDSLSAGETVTIHLANVVYEDELPYLYLGIMDMGVSFDDTAVYVDIAD